MADSTSKVLVLGNPNGKALKALTKINGIQKSKNGPFDLAILLGDVFLESSAADELERLKRENIKLELPVYFSVGSHEYIPQVIQTVIDESPSNQVVEGLTFLGPVGLVTTSKGLRLACVGGEKSGKDLVDSDTKSRTEPETTATASTITESATESNQSTAPEPNAPSASSSRSTNELNLLQTQTQPVDIFFSYNWPSKITAFTKDDKNLDVATSSSLDSLTQTLKPRYHFSCGNEKGLFWERPPYRNSGTDILTRFISLGQFEGSSRWFYAFSIPSNPPPLLTEPTGTTANPFEYVEPVLREDEPSEEPPEEPNSNNSLNNYIWGTNGGSLKRGGDPLYQDRRGRKDRKPDVSPDTCFLCLSNPNLATQLIVSIADECYVALAKGPLTKNLSSKLKSPCHLLIVPIAHIPTNYVLEEKPRLALELERSKYFTAIKHMLASYDYSYVAFEISRRKNVHIHTQIVPIPLDKLDKVEDTFYEHAQLAGYDMTKRTLDPDETEYFKVILPNSKESLVIELDSRSRFDLQFGRKVLAFLLDTPDRIDWRQCIQTEAEEAQSAQAFKDAFSSFDFTL